MYLGIVESLFESRSNLTTTSASIWSCQSTNRIERTSCLTSCGVEGQIVENFKVRVEHKAGVSAVSQKAIELPLGSCQVSGVHILLPEKGFKCELVFDITTKA